MQKQTTTQATTKRPAVQIDAPSTITDAFTPDVNAKLAKLAKLEQEIQAAADAKAKRDAERKERETRRLADLNATPNADAAVIVTRALDLHDATQEYADALRGEVGNVLQLSTFDNLRNAHKQAATAVEIARDATVGKRERLTKGSDRHFATIMMLIKE